MVSVVCFILLFIVIIHRLLIVTGSSAPLISGEKNVRGFIKSGFPD